VAFKKFNPANVLCRDKRTARWYVIHNGTYLFSHTKGQTGSTGLPGMDGQKGDKGDTGEKGILHYL